MFKDVAKAFLGHLKETLLQFYGEDPQKSPDYGRIVSTNHFDRLTKLLSSGTIFHGGQHDRTDRFDRANGAGQRIAGLARDAGRDFRPHSTDPGGRRRSGSDRLRQRVAEPSRSLLCSLTIGPQPSRS